MNVPQSVLNGDKHEHGSFIFSWHGWDGLLGSWDTWERLGGFDVGAEIKGKWEWRLGCSSGQSFSQALTSLHIKILQWIQEETSFLGHRVQEESSPCCGAPGRGVFSLFLTLAALGMVHQTLCGPGFKADKDRLSWHLTELTTKSRGVLSRGGFGWVERGKKQVEKSICGAG